MEDTTGRIADDFSLQTVEETADAVIEDVDVGARRGANKNEEKEWQPVTKLGRLVKAGKIKSMEEIYLHSLPIKEYQIVDSFLPGLKDEVMKVREREIHGFKIGT